MKHQILRAIVFNIAYLNIQVPLQSFYVALLFTNVYSFAYKREHPVSNFLDQDLFVVISEKEDHKIRIVKIPLN